MRGIRRKRNTCRSGDIITVIEMGTIKIEIRRNRDLSFTVKGDFAFDKGLLPKMTPEQEALQHELEKKRNSFERGIWQAAIREGWKDLDGNLILPTTHEIGYDWEDVDGAGLKRAKTVYIRPIKSEWMQ